ncbi:MAG: hypothetical protein R3285_11025, partial [Kiloniellales bacterium]|nr:hypothetical protein [Kiloniellales bacterium]
MGIEALSNRNQQELAVRVDAASAKARELKAELEAAQRRIAELISEKEANGAVSMTRPPVPTRERMRARRYTRGGVILAASVAASFVALLAWGAMTFIQFASSEPIPPLAASEETSAGPSQADLEQPPAGSAPSPADPATGGLDPNRAAAPAQVDDLAAAQRQIARLSAEVEASDIMIARLRDELSQARLAAEGPREPASSDGEPGTASQGPESGLAAAVTRARVVELQRELEAARQQIEDLTAAVARAEAEAAKHRSELVARQQLPAAPPPAAPSDQGAGEHETDTAAPQEAEATAAIPVIEEVLTAAESSSDPPDPPASEVTTVRNTVSP